MFNNLIGKNKELGRFLFCERYTLPPVKNAMYIAEGQDLKRGAVVDVNGVLVGTNSLIPYAVLESDCDTRDGGKQASVFIKGEFNFDKLSFASGLDKSDMDNIVYNGNSVGIVIKPYEYDEGFNPIMAPAGTSQSNPLMTAADTERMIDAMKPIDAMTLRFEFSKKNYNPETAEVGSAGTWVKLDSPTLNIWDWTNEETDWHESFKGAFTDADNEVSIIAAGDTSEVTTIAGMFAGVFVNSPTQSNYSLTSRNNVVSCVPFDVSKCNNFHNCFCGTCLKEVVKFRYNNLLTYSTDSLNGVFADSYITYADNVDFNGINASVIAILCRCSRLTRASFKGVGNITNISGTCSRCTELKDVIIDEEFTNCTAIQGFLQNSSKVVKVRLNAPKNGLDCQATFNGCRALVDLSLQIGKPSRVDYMFTNCNSIPSLPMLDTSSVSRFDQMMRYCYKLETIPNYDVSSSTNVNKMCEYMIGAKYGILEMYNKLLARGASITNHTDCFLNCGRDTPEGRAALAQIPQSWGGLAEG